jgi:hypothetical protein
MKTDAEYDAELRFKRGDRFVVEIPIFEDFCRDKNQLDILAEGAKIEIVGYAKLAWPRRGIGYLVAENGVPYVQPLARKCLERYTRPVGEGE